MARNKKAKARAAAKALSRAASGKKVKKATKPTSQAAGQAGGNAQGSDRKVAKQLKEFRHTTKMQRRKALAARDQWAAPPPSNLVARLDAPKKSKYHSYFEFAENTEKKEKPLNFGVTKETQPYPGYKFVPVGDPIMTNKCKELSREQGAMIYIVTLSNDLASKISEHVHRSGYHFREVIVDQARAAVGETTASTNLEPIPKTQEEINKQADAAIRDLFPRIPNTDRQMIIDHAFKLGNLFKGSEVVGLQAHLPLSRRVQLAVLAHIRHTHTRYDLLLRETSWENARKVVEPVCLDFILKWRGDEETGRDQMDEILREIVVITDSDDSSENSDDDEDDDDDDDEESDDTSDDERDSSSRLSEDIIQQMTPGQLRPSHSRHGLAKDDIHDLHMIEPTMGSARVYHTDPRPYEQHKKSHHGFKRYQAAWDDAVSRRDHGSTIFDDSSRGSAPNRAYQSSNASHSHQTMQVLPETKHTLPVYASGSQYYTQPVIQEQLQPRHGNYSSQRSEVREQVMARQYVERPLYDQNSLSQRGTPTYLSMEQKPSQVVSRSPSHGLKDMLVPSIEQGSSDASRNHDHQRRQVIVIDDSPPLKRRRFVHEDESSRLKSLPHGEGSYLSRTARHPEFSSVHSSDFIPQSRQRAPVYDATPADAFHFAPKSNDVGYEHERMQARNRDMESSQYVSVPQGHDNGFRGSPMPTSYNVVDERARVTERARAPPHPSNAGTHRFIPDNDSHFRPILVNQGVAPRPYEDKSEGFVTIRRAQSPVQERTRYEVNAMAYGVNARAQPVRYNQDDYEVQRQVFEPQLAIRQRPLPTPQPTRQYIILD